MRHEFDPWSLLWGLAFAAVAVVGLAGGLDRLWVDPDLWSTGVLVPAGLILVGLVVGGVASATLRRRSRHASADRAVDVDRTAEDPSTTA